MTKASSLDWVFSLLWGDDYNVDRVKIALRMSSEPVLVGKKKVYRVQKKRERDRENMD